MNFFFNRIFCSRICPNTFLGIRVEYIHEKYGRLDQNPIAIHRSWFAIRLLEYTSFSWSAHGACTKFHLCLNCNARAKKKRWKQWPIFHFCQLFCWKIPGISISFYYPSISMKFKNMKATRRAPEAARLKFAENSHCCGCISLIKFQDVKSSCSH